MLTGLMSMYFGALIPIVMCFMLLGMVFLEKILIKKVQERKDALVASGDLVLESSGGSEEKTYTYKGVLWQPPRILAVLPLALAIAGGFLLKGNLEAKNTWPRVNGIVTHVDRERSSDSDGHSTTTYKPTFRYESSEAAGQFFKASPRTYASDWNFAIGETVVIAISPDDPTRCKLLDWVSIYVLPGILIAVGGLWTFGVFGIHHGIGKHNEKVRSRKASESGPQPSGEIDHTEGNS